MNESKYQPLADRMRPRTLEGMAGQDYLLGKDKPLAVALATKQLHSMLFWGPPGSGKTTLARLIASRFDAHWVSMSAVLSGVKEVRQVIEEAASIRKEQNRATILFVDEVHRFNKSQQDAFLPAVENGLLTFVGATTENPSFALNNALLSRITVYVLQPLTLEALKQIAYAALTDKTCGLGAHPPELSEAMLEKLCFAADGDARRLLNLLELAAGLALDGEPSDEVVIADLLRNIPQRFDKGGDVFYDQISALHKSIRGSAPDAALYWFARMLLGGCDPLYIARRLLRIASEDVGNADPRALQLALNAWHVQERLGSPEGELALAQAVTFLACAAKSNAVHRAFKSATQDAERQGSLAVPMHLRNAPTQLMKKLGHGHGYCYSHDEADGYALGENYFPELLGDRRYYHPTDRGLELQIGEKLRKLREADARHHAASVTNKETTRDA